VKFSCGVSRAEMEESVSGQTKTPGRRKETDLKDRCYKASIILCLEVRRFGLGLVSNRLRSRKYIVFPAIPVNIPVYC
jgi:hypothetical protein